MHSERCAPMRAAGARSLCISSFHHRGTQKQPGLVLGLDQGGACRGVAFRVEPAQADATLAYLREREQITDVYVEVHKPVSLLDGSGRELEALCYMVDRGHPQFAGLAYLREREQITDVYVEVHKPVSLLDGSGRELEALCYMVDRGHPQYAG